MSSFSENQPPSSSQFLPPQSAQIHRSFFGGLSSDVGPLSSSQPEPARRSIFGGPRQDDASESEDVLGSLKPETLAFDQQDDFDRLMREQPLEAGYGSDGESYEDSDDDKRRLKSVHGAPQSSASVSSTPMTYVIDRGLDLPPGVERPNRWTGNPSTYRRILAQDRGAYDGLVEARARDLAAHLYNCFAIRNQGKRSTQGILGTEDDDGQEKFNIPKHWGAWPLSASRVPRPDEYTQRILDDPETLRAPPDLRPSAELEETIIACMMRDAKETFREQDLDDDSANTNRPGRTEIPETLTDDEDKKEAAAINETSRLRPVIQADDDKTRRQLRPLARNVISQLERVLSGMHRSMHGRIQHYDFSDESASDIDDDTSRSLSPQKPRGRSRSRGRKTFRSSRQTQRKGTSSGRSRNGQSSTGPETEDEPMRNVSDSRERSRSSHADETNDAKPEGAPAKAQRKLALRDWSDVMGIASMMGLPSAVVMRASNRCADLFGQDMTFRVFREGRVEKTAGQRDSSYEYEYFESESEDVEREPTPPTERKRKRRSRERSVSQAKRSRERPAPTPTPGPSSSAAAGPAAVAGPSEAGGNLRSSPPTQREPTPRHRGRGKARDKADLVCPLRLCPRHTQGFSRVWNLNLHMKRVHPGYTSKEERQRSRSQSVPRPAPQVIDID